MAVFQMLAQLI